MPHDSLFLENVLNKTVYAALCKKPDYIRFGKNCFLRSPCVEKASFEELRLGHSDYKEFLSLDGQLRLPGFSPPATKFSGCSPRSIREE